jgi:hypothetical protein
VAVILWRPPPGKRLIELASSDVATKTRIAQRCLEVYQDIITSDGYFPHFADAIVVDEFGDVGIVDWHRFGLWPGLPEDKWVNEEWQRGFAQKMRRMVRDLSNRLGSVHHFLDIHFNQYPQPQETSLKVLSTD